MRPVRRKAAAAPSRSAELARAIVAVAHVGRLVPAAPDPREPGSVLAVSIVDDGGEPWVLAPPWERPPAGPARLHVAQPVPPGVTEPPPGTAPRPAAAHRAGVVLLAGRLEARTVSTLRALPSALRGALDKHRACLDLGGWPALSVSRFVVAGIGVTPPGDGRPAALEPVPLADYAACEPDLWQLQEPALLEHLNATHAAALVGLARRAGAPDAAFASAHAADADGLTLAVVGLDGARYLRLPYGRRLGSPAEVGSALFG